MTDSERLDLILAEMQGMKKDTEEVKKGLGEVKKDIEDVKADMEDVKADVEDVRQKVVKMDSIIENELRINIQRIAEGHLDLSRNLHEAMKPHNELEMLSIKVRVLESDVKELKQKIL